MIEEMRKEFEEFWVNYCEKRGVNCNLARLINDEYASWPEHNAYVGWQASREAMKPIKLPKTMKNTQEQSCYYYNDAIDECKEAIQQAGYKVEE
jgi:hypothetical protein